MSDIEYADIMRDDGSDIEATSAAENIVENSVESTVQTPVEAPEDQPTPSIAENNIDDEYAAFMNSDNEGVEGQDEADLVNTDANSQAINTFVLLQGEEWILDLRNEQEIFITIKEGICELFGVELAINTEFTFNSQEKLCLLAVEACKIEYRSNRTLLKSFPDCIVSHDPNVIGLYAISLQLLQKRMNGLRGPRCLIIGDKTSGKSSIAKTLLSYASKMTGSTSTPLFVNLDPTKGIFTMPGALSATVVNDILQPESAIWGEPLTSSTHPLVATFEPIIKHFGFEEINKYNHDYYRQLLDSLVDDCKIIMDNYTEINKTGMFVDTCTFKLVSDEPKEEKEEPVDEVKKEEEKLSAVEVKQEDTNSDFLSAPEINNDLIKKEDDDYKMSSSGQESEYEDDDEDDDYEIKKKEEKVVDLEQATDDKLIELPYDVNFINDIANKFEIDHIFDICNVDGHPIVNNYLKDRIKALTSVVKRAYIYPIVQNKSLDASSLSDSYKRFAQRAAIRAYFYGGTPRFTLSPYTVTVRYEDVNIYQHNPDKCGDLLHIENITKEILQYGILAVTNSDTTERDTTKILNSGVIGYVLVLSVNDMANKQLIKILSPTMGDLPKKMMILTDFKYYE